MKLLHISVPVELHTLSVFEVGTNKPLINHGKMQHRVANELGKDIVSFCEQEHNDAVGFVVAGYVLDLLEEEHIDALTTLQTYVAKNDVSLYGVPFYGTSFTVMNADECRTQLQLETDALQKYFGKSLTGLYVGEDHISSELKSVFSELHLSIMNSSSDYHHVFTLETYDVHATTTQTADGAYSTSLLSAKPSSELGGHIQEELQSLYPHVLALGDEETLTNWRFLGNQQLLEELDTDTHTQGYESYMNTMNILNDVGHELLSVSKAQQGEFISDVTIVDSPSKLLGV